ncbi:fimbrial protein [Vibrio hippocampi]|uniref:Fimbrial protein n=1 Tax=Vibrio hippocampi TaxID=654686 RepID=A0ABN8DPH4_9VIBR|nr:hypothetical protein [Vibrio hippocampi]CAH0530403.1 hypothetical protein VHP8226_04046 [Vibrio hippocampi]
MKNKLLVSASAVAIMLGSLSVQANTGTVYFYGAVTDATCDLTPVQDGVESDRIDLGTMAPSDLMAPAVNFTIEPKSGGTCDALTGMDAEIDWVFGSNGLGDKGLANTTGSATGVHIGLAYGATAISQNTGVVSLGTVPATGFAPEFTAQMLNTSGDDGNGDPVVNATAGSVKSDVSFAVIYK